MRIDRTSIQNLFLYSYFFSVNVENLDPLGTGGVFSISKLIGIIYLIAVFPSYKILLFLTKRNLYFFWPIILFFAWLTVISIVNINSFSSRIIEVAMLLNILIFFAIVNHARKDSLVLDKAMYALAIGSIFTSLLLLFGIGLTESDDPIARFTFFNAGPNELGIKLATGAIVLVVMSVQNYLRFSKAHRYLLILFVPLLFFTIAQTGSRTAFLVPLVSGLIWFFFKIAATRNKFVAVATGVPALALVFLPLVFFALQLSEVMVDRIGKIGGSGDFSPNGRIFLWTRFFSAIQDNLYFGNGLSGFDLLSNRLFGWVESPHNVLLEVMLYTGLIGLTIYLLFILRIVGASYRLFKDNHKLLPALLLPTVMAFTLALQGLSEKTCWLVLAYIVGTFLYNKNRSVKNPIKI